MILFTWALGVYRITGGSKRVRQHYKNRRGHSETHTQTHMEGTVWRHRIHRGEMTRGRGKAMLPPAKECWRLPEGGRGKECSHPGSFRGCLALLTTWFWTPGLPKLRESTSVVLTHQVIHYCSPRKHPVHLSFVQSTRPGSWTPRNRCKRNVGSVDKRIHPGPCIATLILTQSQQNEWKLQYAVKRDLVRNRARAAHTWMNFTQGWAEGTRHEREAAL